MNISSELRMRSESKCEMCNSSQELKTYVVPPKSGVSLDEQVLLCSICLGQIEHPETINTNHWRCLNESIWNPNPPVQVVSYRMLKKLENEQWAADLLGMIYMEDNTREWAAMNNRPSEKELVHSDCNDQVLAAGDTVTLIKDLNVKGANFVAKRGTAVRRISLVADNVEHIQGKINGQTIIILTKFVKRS